MEGTAKEDGAEEDCAVLDDAEDTVRGEGHESPLEEEPDVGAGSNVSNCMLLVHGG